VSGVAEIRELAARELLPLAGGESGRINRPLLQAMGAHGLLAQLFPASGQASATALCRLREGLAQVSTEAETALALQGLGGYPILASATPPVRTQWAGPITAGQAAVGFALSEAAAGSDVAAMSLRAARDGDGWRLDGEKTWISNAPEADVYSVFARTSAEGARGVTGFVVAGTAAGLSGTPLDMLSPHAIGTLRFDGVHVPDNAVLGEVGGGFAVAMRTLDMFRPSVGAFAVGMAQAALDASVAWAGSREAFGAPLRKMQSVAHNLAEMATRTEAARLMVYAAAAAYDRGDADVTKRSAMAKLFATENAQWVIDAAVQLHGARGVQRGHLLEHLYREVRATRIYEGASEVQRSIIARELYR